MKEKLWGENKKAIIRQYVILLVVDKNKCSIQHNDVKSESNPECLNVSFVPTFQ